MRLTKHQQAAIDFYGLDWAKSDEPGAGWFAYQDHLNPFKNGYRGSSCECLHDIVDMYDNRDADNDVALREATVIIKQYVELLDGEQWLAVRVWLQKWGRD